MEMTYEEAVEVLEELIDLFADVQNDTIDTALRMGIYALEDKSEC